VRDVAECVSRTPGVDPVRIRPRRPHELGRTEPALVTYVSDPERLRFAGGGPRPSCAARSPSCPKSRPAAVVMAVGTRHDRAEIADAEEIPLGTAKSRIRAGSKLHFPDTSTGQRSY